jgi:hypothetical protein
MRPATLPTRFTNTGQLLQALGLGSVVVALLALVRTLVIALRRLRERD